MNRQLKQPKDIIKEDKELQQRIDKLTLKQKRLLFEIVNNPQIEKGPALLRAGYSQSTSQNPAMIMREKTMVELFEHIGMTDLFLAKQVKKGLTKADKPVIYEGEITDTYPDYHARHKFLETALKVKGHLTTINQTNILAQDYEIEIINEPATQPEKPFEKK